MSGWYYQHILEELEDLRDYLNSLFHWIHETNQKTPLPDPGSQPVKMASSVQGNLRVDVIDHDDEVIVRADMIIGDQKKDIKIDLIDSQALKIFCDRKGEKKDESENYSMCERSFGSMTRIVPLPKPVTEEGSHAIFKDGVLEVHLKKSKPGADSTIAIE